MPKVKRSGHHVQTFVVDDPVIISSDQPPSPERDRAAAKAIAHLLDGEPLEAPEWLISWSVWRSF